MAVFRPANSVRRSTYSGDDAYDPAAWREARTFAAQADPAAGCVLPATELSRRRAWRAPGGLSGDAAYDPVAGGLPELSLQASAQEPGIGVACLQETTD